MSGRAVFSEGDAARPVTASRPPVRACKTSKHYRSRLARPLFFKAVHSKIATVRQSLAEVRFVPEAPTRSWAAANPPRSVHSLQVPDDDAWFYAGRSVTQPLGC